jgi:hypothetical protein
MELGMHPTILHPRRSQIAPKWMRRAPDNASAAQIAECNSITLRRIALRATSCRPHTGLSHRGRRGRTHRASGSSARVFLTLRRILPIMQTGPSPDRSVKRTPTSVQGLAWLVDRALPAALAS